MPIMMQARNLLYGILRDGLYYLPLDQIGENWMPFADYRQVDVAVIDTKTDKVVKVISEKTSGLCFPTRPFPQRDGIYK